MKGHKEHHHRAHKAEGGEAHGDAKTGTDEWKEDLDKKTPMRVHAPEIEKEADEKKHGGRAKRKRGGHVHHEHGKHLGHAKHVGHVHGEAAHHHAGRKARKSGGSAEEHVFSAARHGIDPKFHKDMLVD